MKLFLHICSLYTLLVASNSFTTKYSLPVDKVIESFGYRAENHYITTKDHYILHVHRIPYGKNQSNNAGNRPVAFLQHGYECASDNFALLDKSLGYLLADKGYDVWIGNSRGNLYSTNNTKLNPYLNMNQFWNFTFLEMAQYDMTACIDYILNITNQATMKFVTHSRGGDIIFSLCSLYPEYNSKIEAIHAMAPGNYLKNSTLYLYNLGVLLNFETLKLIFDVIGNYGLPGSVGLINIVHYVLSSLCPFNLYICQLLLNKLAGKINVKKQFVPYVLGHFPGGAQTKDALFLQQYHVSGRFALYDYGKIVNQYYYHSAEPPLIPLGNCDVPTYLYAGIGDLYVNITGVQLLAEQLPNMKKFIVAKDPSFGHMDFVYSEEAYSQIFEPMLEYF